MNKCEHKNFTHSFCDECGVHYNDAATEILASSMDIPVVGEWLYFWENGKLSFSEIHDVIKPDKDYLVLLGKFAKAWYNYDVLLPLQKDLCDKYMDQEAGISDIEVIQGEFVVENNKERLITMFDSVDSNTAYEMIFVDAPDKTAVEFLTREFSEEFLKSYMYETYTIASDDDMKEAMLEYFKGYIEDNQLDLETEVLFFSKEDVNKGLTTVIQSGQLALVQDLICGIYSPSSILKCNLPKNHIGEHKVIIMENGVEKTTGIWTGAGQPPKPVEVYDYNDLCPKKIPPRDVFCNRKVGHTGACSQDYDPGYKNATSKTAYVAGPPCHSGDVKIFEKGNLTCFAGGKSRGGGNISLDLLVDLTNSVDEDLRQVGTFDADLQKVIAAQQADYATTLNIDWKDFGVNHNLTVSFWKDLAKYVRAKAKKGKFRIEAMCQGGHGRTGTFWACLGFHLNLYNKKKEDPITWIRRVHCTHAVETEGQVKYVEKMTGVKIPDEVAKKLKHGTVTTYTSYTSAPKGSGVAAGATTSLFNQPADAAYAATADDDNDSWNDKYGFYA